MKTFLNRNAIYNATMALYGNISRIFYFIKKYFVQFALILEKQKECHYYKAVAFSIEQNYSQAMYISILSPSVSKQGITPS